MKIEDIHIHLGKRVILNTSPTDILDALGIHTYEGRKYAVPTLDTNLKLFGGLDLDGRVQVIDSESNVYFIPHQYIDLPQSKYILGVYVCSHPDDCNCNDYAIRDRATGTTIGTYYNEEQANKVLAILNGTT